MTAVACRAPQILAHKNTKNLCVGAGLWTRQREQTSMLLCSNVRQEYWLTFHSAVGLFSTLSAVAKRGGRSLGTHQYVDRRTGDRKETPHFWFHRGPCGPRRKHGREWLESRLSLSSHQKIFEAMQQQTQSLNLPEEPALKMREFSLLCIQSAYPTEEM